MPNPKKKVVKLDDKRLKLVIRYFIEAFESTNLKDSELIIKKTQTSGFWSVLASLFPGPESIKEKVIDIFAVTEYTLLESTLHMDSTPEMLLSEYNDYWTGGVLKLNGNTVEQITSAVITDHNILIFELLFRMAADALSVNLNPAHDGLILIRMMHTFISKIKSDSTLLGNGSHVSPVAIALATDHEVWMGWLNEMVGSVKMIHAHITTISSLREYLAKTSMVIKRQLLAELTTLEVPSVKKLGQEHFEDAVIQWCLEDLEDQCIVVGEGGKLPDSHARARMRMDAAMQHAAAMTISTGSRFSADRSLRVARSIANIEKSVLRKVSGKVDNVNRLYALWEEADDLISLTTQLEGMNIAMGWLAITSGFLKLHAIANQYRNFAKRSIAILKVTSDAPIFTSHIGMALIMLESTSAKQLANIGMVAATQLQNLQNPIYQKSILDHIKNLIMQFKETQTKFARSEGFEEFVEAKMYDTFYNALSDQKPSLEPKPASNPISVQMREQPPTPSSFMSSSAPATLTHGRTSSVGHAARPRTDSQIDSLCAERKLKLYDSKKKFKARSAKNDDKNFVYLYPTDARDKWAYRYMKKNESGKWEKINLEISDKKLIVILNKKSLDEETKKFLVKYILDEENRETLLSEYMEKASSAASSTTMLLTALGREVAIPSPAPAPVVPLLPERKEERKEAQPDPTPEDKPKKPTLDEEREAQRAKMECRRLIGYLTEVKKTAESKDWNSDGASGCRQSDGIPPGIQALRDELKHELGRMSEAEVKLKMQVTLRILGEHLHDPTGSDKRAARAYGQHLQKAEQDFPDIVTAQQRRSPQL